jgi:hypothetical protein
VSLLNDFARMRLYRERASEFELLAENEPLSEARLRYRIIARHYRELADRDERSDKAKVAERLELLKLARRQQQNRHFSISLRLARNCRRQSGPHCGYHVRFAKVTPIPATSLGCDRKCRNA